MPRLAISCILLCVCVLVFGCKPCTDTTLPTDLEATVRLVDKKTGADLLANGVYQQDSMLVCVPSGTCYNAGAGSLVRVSGNALKVKIGSTGGSKTFYLQLNSHDTDTLFYDTHSFSDAQTCKYYRFTFRYNGIALCTDVDGCTSSVAK